MSNFGTVSRRCSSGINKHGLSIPLIEVLDVGNRDMINSLTQESVPLMLASLEYFRHQMRNGQKISVRIGDRHLLIVLEKKMMCISREEHQKILSYMKEHAENLDALPLPGHDGDICRRGVQIVQTADERFKECSDKNHDKQYRARQPHESRSQILKNRRRRSSAKHKLLAICDS